MTRLPDPRSVALADQCLAVLRAADRPLTTAEVTERVGGTYVMWAACPLDPGLDTAYAVLTAQNVRNGLKPPRRTCRAETMQAKWKANHVDFGPDFIAQDRWEAPMNASRTTPQLNRLHRKGLVLKAKHPASQTVLWSLPARSASEVDLESLWALS